MRSVLQAGALTIFFLLLLPSAAVLCTRPSSWYRSFKQPEPVGPVVTRLADIYDRFGVKAFGTLALSVLFFGLAVLPVE